MSLQLVNLGAPPPPILKKYIYREINIIINFRVDVFTLLPPPSLLRIRILMMVFFYCLSRFFLLVYPPPLSKTMSDCYLQKINIIFICINRYKHLRIYLLFFRVLIGPQRKTNLNINSEFAGALQILKVVSFCNA